MFIITYGNVGGMCRRVRPNGKFLMPSETAIRPGGKAKSPSGKAIRQAVRPSGMAIKEKPKGQEAFSFANQASSIFIIWDFLSLEDTFIMIVNEA